MGRLSTEALFGDDFYQDSEVIRISKSSLNLSSATHSGEAILCALILRARQPFEGNVEGNGETLTDELGRPITYGNSALYDVIKLFYWRRLLTRNRAQQPLIQDDFVLSYWIPYDVDSLDSWELNISPSQL